MCDIAEAVISRSIPRWRVFSGHSKPVGIYISVHDFADIVGSELAAVDLWQTEVGQWFTEPHVHEQPEVYLCVEPAGAVGIEIDVAGTTTGLESPFAAMIPARVPHRFRLCRRPDRTCFLVGIFPLLPTVHQNINEKKKEV